MLSTGKRRRNFSKSDVEQADLKRSNSEQEKLEALASISAKADLRIRLLERCQSKSTEDVSMKPRVPVEKLILPKIEQKSSFAITLPAQFLKELHSPHVQELYGTSNYIDILEKAFRTTTSLLLVRRFNSEGETGKTV